jgi:hypothetical protein
MAQQITYISPPQTKNPGESAVFNCTVQKTSVQTVAWLKDSNMLTLNNILTSPDGRFKIIVDDASNTYSLQVSNSIR